MEKLTTKHAALLSAGALSIILGACSKPETQSTGVKPSTTMKKDSCTYSTVNVLPASTDKIDMQIIAPRESDPWKNSYAFSVIGNQVEVRQVPGNGRKGSVIDPNHPVATKSFEQGNRDGIFFVDQNPGIIVRVTTDPDHIATPMVPINVSFCPPSSDKA